MDNMFNFIKSLFDDHNPYKEHRDSVWNDYNIQEIIDTTDYDSMCSGVEIFTHYDNEIRDLDW